MKYMIIKNWALLALFLALGMHQSLFCPPVRSVSAYRSSSPQSPTFDGPPSPALSTGSFGFSRYRSPSPVSASRSTSPVIQSQSQLLEHYQSQMPIFEPGTQTYDANSDAPRHTVGTQASVSPWRPVPGSIRYQATGEITGRMTLPAERPNRGAVGRITVDPLGNRTSSVFSRPVAKSRSFSTQVNEDSFPTPPRLSVARQNLSNMAEMETQTDPTGVGQPGATIGKPVVMPYAQRLARTEYKKRATIGKQQERAFNDLLKQDKDAQNAHLLRNLPGLDPSHLNDPVDRSIIELVNEHGINGFPNTSPLGYAVFYKRPALVRALLENGARDFDGSILKYAREHNIRTNSEIINLLELYNPHNTSN